MTPDERSHALELADELLADIELDRLPLDKLLLKGGRLSRLTEDDDFSEWIKKELGSYYADDFNGLHWRLTECFSSSRGLREPVVLKDGDGLAQVAGLARAAA